MPPHELGRRADVDDAAVVDDRHAVAEPLGFLHQVRRQKDRLAALADAAHEIPDRPPRLRVESGRQLVEKHQLRVVDERERDEEPLLLAAGQRHEPGVPLVAQAELLDQAIAVHRLPIERRPEADGFPDLDPLLELRLLELHADPLLQRVDVPSGIQAQDRDGAAIGRAQTLDALHRRGLAGAVRPDQPEDFPRLHVERDLVHGDGPAVRLPDGGNVNDRLGRHGRLARHLTTKRFAGFLGQRATLFRRWGRSLPSGIRPPDVSEAIGWTGIALAEPPDERQYVLALALADGARQVRAHLFGAQDPFGFFLKSGRQTIRSR